MGKGKVYVLTNDLMPGIIKIGITEGNIEDRIKSLDNTSLPLPFRFYYAIETERYKEIEQFVHNAFSDFRVRENREFFEMEPERAVAALRISGAQEIKKSNEMIDEKGQKVEEKVVKTTSSKKRFSFSFVNIPLNSELSFTRDESKKCIVISDNQVQYNGSVYSLSKLADILLREMGYEWKSVQGPAYFEYNGKTLYELKKENEISEEEDEENLSS